MMTALKDQPSLQQAMQAMDALKTYKYALLAATVQDMDVHSETAEVNNTVHSYSGRSKRQRDRTFCHFCRRPRHEEQVCRKKNKKGSTIDTIHSGSLKFGTGAQSFQVDNVLYSPNATSNLLALTKLFKTIPGLEINHSVVKSAKTGTIATVLENGLYLKSKPQEPEQSTDVERVAAVNNNINVHARLGHVGPQLEKFITSEIMPTWKSCSQPPDVPVVRKENSQTIIPRLPPQSTTHLHNPLN